MLRGLLKSCVIIAFLVLFCTGRGVILCLIAPKWQIMPVMIWWKCEIIKLPRRLAAFAFLYIYIYIIILFIYFLLLQIYATRLEEAKQLFTQIHFHSHFWIWGVITRERNGFISFNPAGAAICSSNICLHGFNSSKAARLSNAKKKWE